MKDVLIINATRMGDLIQTTPVIAGLKDRFQGIRITLLVNADFAEICKYIPSIDRLVIINIKDVIKLLNNVMLVECFNYLDNIINQVNDTCYDMVINFTHSNSSAVLTPLINAMEVRGLTMDEEGHSFKKHPWIKYLFNVIPGRKYNPFHLCDMHLKAGGAIPYKNGLHLNVPDDMVEWADVLLMRNNVGENDLLIGFHVGASAEDKRWHTRSFARLADRLAESLGAKILLTGSVSEGSYGEEFESISKTRPLNFIGKTDIKELTALIKRCDLFVSNDSGPLHIATAVGTKAINISLASVHFRETGPYGNGHYIIKADIPCSPCHFFSDCPDMVCKGVINEDNVFELTKMAMSKEELTWIEDSPLWRDVQIYRSYFDDDGLVEFKPLIKRPLTKEMLFTHIYRQTWLKILDGKDSFNVDYVSRSLIERFNDWYEIESIDVRIIEEDFNALIRLNTLADMGLSRVKMIAKEVKRDNPDAGWIKEIWKDIPTIDKEIETVGYTHPPLLPLTTFFKYGKEGLEGRDIAALSEETCVLYSELKEHTMMMLNIFEHIRPVFKNLLKKEEGIWS